MAIDTRIVEYWVRADRDIRICALALPGPGGAIVDVSQIPDVVATMIQ